MKVTEQMIDAAMTIFDSGYAANRDGIATAIERAIDAAERQPICWSITRDGRHLGFFSLDRSLVYQELHRLNARVPAAGRSVVPLYE
ncbi:hypothetical protein IP84_16955 [beta proteobacterium AAP99]|nr:hypothetical protein IP84_16955 [beta proteobacterium AAP99]